jgi:hypothetical protein
MVEKVLKLVGLENKIDTSPDGIDQLKLVGLLFSCFVGFIVLFVFPWIYGILKLGLLIFK